MTSSEKKEQLYCAKCGQEIRWSGQFCDNCQYKNSKFPELKKEIDYGNIVGTIVVWAAIFFFFYWAGK